LKDELIRALVQPNNIGCGHIKNMMKSPVDYQMSTDVMRYFIRAFFEYMWLEGIQLVNHYFIISHA
jgi:hypothetical protein